MIWLSRQERATLIGLGVAGLVGVGVLAWQQHRPALGLMGVPQPAEAAQWTAALETARRIDINAAAVAELERLPGIGPKLAERIVADREAAGPFASIEQLTRVPGIGPKLLEGVRAYVTVNE